MYSDIGSAISELDGKMREVRERQRRIGTQDDIEMYDEAFNREHSQMDSLGVRSYGASPRED
jgi:hypothetical protein